MKTLCASTLLLISTSTLTAQWISRFNSALPLWADSALVKSGFWTSHDLSSRTSPVVEVADLDGDGLWDVAAEIVDRSAHRRGLVIVHQVDRSVHIVGAGEDLGSGRNQLPNDASWSVGALIGHRAGLRVNAWHTNAWIIWNGRSYVWVQDSD